jgi:hypothetical protein
LVVTVEVMMMSGVVMEYSVDQCVRVL